MGVVLGCTLQRNAVQLGCPGLVPAGPPASLSPNLLDGLESHSTPLHHLLNPAIARGLNALAGPGNEIECELLTWTHPEQQYTSSTSAVQSGGSPSLSGAGGVTYSFSAAGGGGVREGGHGGSGGSGGEPLRWARCVWRRGTVPIWWGVQLQSLAQVGHAPQQGMGRAGRLWIGGSGAG